MHHQTTEDRRAASPVGDELGFLADLKHPGTQRLLADLTTPREPRTLSFSEAGRVGYCRRADCWFAADEHGYCRHCQAVRDAAAALEQRVLERAVAVLADQGHQPGDLLCPRHRAEFEAVSGRPYGLDTPE